MVHAAQAPGGSTKSARPVQPGLQYLEFGLLQLQSAGSQFARRQCRLRDAFPSMLLGPRDDMIQLVRQDSAHRAAEQNIPTKWISVGDRGFDSATQVVTRQIAEWEYGTVHFLRPAERTGFKKRRRAVHVAIAQELHYYQQAADCLRRNSDPRAQGNTRLFQDVGRLATHFANGYLRIAPIWQHHGSYRGRLAGQKGSGAENRRGKHQKRRTTYMV
jgi:hypothetical protein